MSKKAWHERHILNWHSNKIAKTIFLRPWHLPFKVFLGTWGAEFHVDLQGKRKVQIGSNATLTEKHWHFIYWGHDVSCWPFVIFHKLSKLIFQVWLVYQIPDCDGASATLQHPHHLDWKRELGNWGEGEGREETEQEAEIK